MCTNWNASNVAPVCKESESKGCCVTLCVQTGMLLMLLLCVRNQKARAAV